MTALALASALLYAPTCRAEEKPLEKVEFKARTSWNYQYSQLHVPEEAIPVHPNDAGFLKQDAKIRPNSGLEGALFRVGAEADMSVSKKVSVAAGVDAQLSFDYLSNKKDGAGMYDWNIRPDDTRGKANGSGVYAKANRNLFSIHPFLGLRYRLSTQSQLGFEVSVPFLEKIEEEFGHHRYDSEEKTGTKKFKTSGFRTALTYEIGNNTKWGLGAGLTYERVNLTSDSGEQGNLNGIGAILAIKRKF